MSPYFEPIVLEGRGYELRFVAPEADIWPGSTPGVAAPPIALNTFAVLNQPAMTGRRLPMTNNPNSPDMVSGSWVGRLNDAGDFQLVFPNKEASDGQPWRNRFDASLKRQWIEIYNDGYLEFAGCIEIVDKQRDSITISGHDGLWQTKSAYERDWIVTQAPRDVIERGTQVWRSVVVDDFPGGPLNPQWTVSTQSGGTVTVGAAGGCILTVPASVALAHIGNVTTFPATGIWRAICTIADADTSVAGDPEFSFTIVESAIAGNSDLYEIDFGVFTAGGPSGVATGAKFTEIIGGGGGNPRSFITVATAPTYTFIIESDGEWVSGYINGALIGCFRRGHAATTSLETSMSAVGLGNSTHVVTVQGVLIESCEPFLMAGTDKGDYVLPGYTDTYPSGGLHGRYFNNLDLQSDADSLFKIHAPPRTQAYSGSGVSEYNNRQDTTINFTSAFNPLPGAATTYFSAIWFGAIYLKLSGGDYGIAFTVDDGVRIWIGKTRFGDQIIDSWRGQAPTTYSTTLSASSLASTTARDGWYPIKIEYFNGIDGANAQFFFTPPISYTDPGGTALVGGNQVIVPATSLSPLGCVDQRYQGISHFDLITKTAQAFNYQICCEPRQLESNLFPGVCAPRVREGHDTDAILQPDDAPRFDSEGLLNYANKLDATDTATSLSGNGAGFQNGTQGQLQGLIYDPSSLRQALFDIQGWQDFSDASFESLLQSLLNSELGQRLTPWQVVTGDPTGRPRLANSWPLPSYLTQQRWRPGDGMRIYARDVGIQDVAPRQILTITRQIHSNGVTGTQVGFSARPKTREQQIAKTLFQVRRLGRNYQKQLVTLQSDLSSFINGSGITPGSLSAYFGIALLPGDQIVRAQVRIAYNNGTAGLEINGTDQTTALNGPWTGMPIVIDITGFAATAPSDGRLYLRAINKGAESAVIEPQLIIDVQR